MSDRLTTDRNDARLTFGTDDAPVPQAEAYLIMSEEDLAKGFVRPYRNSYIHVGEQPKNEMRDLTEEERERYAEFDYAMYEIYPESESPLVGRYWTHQQLEAKHCGGVTVMGQKLSETYAANPKFYGSTYCTKCCMHKPVAEFRWSADNTVVGD